MIDKLEIDGPGLGVSRQNGLPAGQLHRLSTLVVARISHDFDWLGRQVAAGELNLGSKAPMEAHCRFDNRSIL